MKISLAPIPYFWPKDRVYAFYESIADTPVDIVCLGETVCYKRNELRLPDWIDIGRMLTARGKTVVLSTLTLIEAAAELNAVRKVCENSEFIVEANDMAAVQYLIEQQLPFVTGPSVNLYNSQSIVQLCRLGLKRWVLPVELSGETLHAILNEMAAEPAAEKLETEVLVYGRLPLAWSARCFTARAHNRSKDRCELACLDYPDGLPLQSREGQRLFTLNGIQTQSGETCDLREYREEMCAMGVDCLRVSPVAQGTAGVLRELKDAIHGIESAHATKENTIDGYWKGYPGLRSVEPPV